jgi:hypothetical protein
MNSRLAAQHVAVFSAIIIKKEAPHEFFSASSPLVIVQSVLY